MKGTKRRRDGAGDGIVVEIEEGKRGEVRDGRRELSRQVIGRKLNFFEFEAIEELVDTTSEPDEGAVRRR